MATHLYEIALIGNIGGLAEVVNRWNYRGDVNAVAGGDAAALVNAMGLNPTGGTFPTATIGAQLQLVVSTAVNWTQCLCRNVYDPTDFIDLPYVPLAAGAATGECLSPINAFGFRSNRTRLDIGRGYKRIPGVVETFVDNLGVINSTTQPALDTLAGLMGDVITFTDGSLTDSFTPVIVSKEKYTTPSGKTAYKYYPTESVQLTHLAVGVVWEAYTRVRSQVSRQIGRGA
jgi:hypothetical protein